MIKTSNSINLFDLQELDFDLDKEQYDIEPIAKRGDIFILGEHRLMCGDSTLKSDLEKLMNNNISDILFTPPPYNVGKSSVLNGNTHMKNSKYKNNDDNSNEYKDFLIKTTQNGIDFSKFVFINIQMLSNNKIDFIDFLSYFKNCLCDIAIWNKGFGAPAMAHKVMNSAFEFILVFSKYNNSRAIGTKDFRGTIPNVINCSQQTKNNYSNVHSATFPLEFVSYFISNFTEKNNIVLDIFGGTGTTMIACQKLNRKCYMMEIDPKYCDIIIKRWENFTGRKAEKLNV